MFGLIYMECLKNIGDKNILFSIIGSLGTTLGIDTTTTKPRMDRTFGQYVRARLVHMI